VFNVIDKTVHRSKRRVVGAAINDRSMRQFEPTMVKEVDIFLLQLLSSSQLSRPVNMSSKLKRLGIDIVGHLAFGQPHQTQTDPKHRFLIGGITAAGLHNNALMQFPSLAQPWILYPLKLLTLRQQQKGLAKLEKLTQQRLIFYCYK
jgi:cytochrome P450